MTNYFFAWFKNTETGESFGGIYTNIDKYHNDNFSPLHMPVFVTDFRLSRCGSYAEKKEALYNLALNMQEAMSEVPLSYNEYAIIGEFFERYGKRYGMLKEFRENGIC